MIKINKDVIIFVYERFHIIKVYPTDKIISNIELDIGIRKIELNEFLMYIEAGYDIEIKSGAYSINKINRFC
ncbi:hypothetical protein C5F64_16290 [Photobacterium damselae subsp. damselae]|uniref:Uncharacterized protein n=1 Tax=Photobacterium damselae TaxID=38293 RepID=A0A2T3Q6F8_PHODM|nr:hypothetical protein C5F64_16290 [Photobacterium damselae subsp. damselae]PSW79378.1 hypothetical protein CTN07_20600 [Photobacterium damselae]PSB85383.1 hypothetical protein C5F62_04385 [Photobacterium damselae subsp. damselae]PSB90612.1 hypothetical protein C5F63_01325 [Photobacterium damselae subsp. damselae]SPY31262.1 Uncharacterised protein [Photobacterium damselae]